MSHKRDRDDKDKKQKFRPGGHVGKEQREYFIKAFDEVRNLGATQFDVKEKKTFARQKLVAQGRKVARHPQPLKDSLSRRKKEKKIYERDVLNAAANGDTIPKKPSMMKKNDEEKKDRGLTMKNGRFADGMHYLSKNDVKNVYTKKEKKRF
ncbi:hypothetical protein SAMD00019534_088250 [Acytostelium subglobosum LB1]|uniref:hypothetical protein n=1 Tax=Acytostelium subglobosum LB1 TaxID=1410327 RepID=UPI000644E9C1|nr:hypothetical protein SAMD00019534_088250 [Acytostelium subglobosum LB1]GAM25650.1 hypothetical protein SAMD00019534_088250 [Acytostelium subglobosum LB1]|eukprot:XP_012751636.1 hypothetical protein SAMD00019534_088250 [Acytostelium subglobosum LB1]